MLTQTAPVIATPALSADKPARNGAVKAQEPLEIEAQIAYMEQPDHVRTHARARDLVLPHLQSKASQVKKHIWDVFIYRLCLRQEESGCQASAAVLCTYTAVRQPPEVGPEFRVLSLSSPEDGICSFSCHCLFPPRCRLCSSHRS